MFPATATEGDAPFRAFVVVIRGRLSCLSLLALSSRHIGESAVTGCG